MAANTVIGTPHYLSPEVFNKQPYSYKSDIWSLGACLYEMCALRLAFKGGNLVTLMQQIVHGNHEPLPINVFVIPLVVLVDRLLSKDPDDRPSAADLMRDQFVRSFILEKPPAAPCMGEYPGQPASSSSSSSRVPRPPSIRTPFRRTRPLVASRPITCNYPPVEKDDLEFQTAIAEQPQPQIISPPDRLLPGRINTFSSLSGTSFQNIMM
jgi:serine/threonine protein kinase